MLQREDGEGYQIERLSDQDEIAIRYMFPSSGRIRPVSGIYRGRCPWSGSLVEGDLNARVPPAPVVRCVRWWRWTLLVVRLQLAVSTPARFDYGMSSVQKCRSVKSTSATGRGGLQAKLNRPSKPIDTLLQASVLGVHMLPCRRDVAPRFGYQMGFTLGWSSIAASATATDGARW